MSADAQERMLQLLSDQATEGLDAADRDELKRLLVLNPECDAHGFERAAAAAALAFVFPSSEAVPGALRDRLLTDARGYFCGEACT